MELLHPPALGDLRDTTGSPHDASETLRRVSRARISVMARGADNMRRNSGLIQICTGMAMANTTQSRACLAEPQNAESARVEDTELSVISPHPDAETLDYVH